MTGLGFASLEGRECPLSGNLAVEPHSLLSGGSDIDTNCAAFALGRFV